MWVDPDSFGSLHHPVTDDDWQSLVAVSGGGALFGTVLDVVRRNRCRTVVVENRYVDADFRSDFSAFWSKRFDAGPAFARRVHFFRARIPEERLHRLPATPGYLGYSVIRPSPYADGRIGRTVLAPPPRFRGATLALLQDEVSLFGNRLEVMGVPYSEQDGEFLRCAHAAIWACHYSAHRRGLVGRRLTAELVRMTPVGVSRFRSLPSPGMTLEQVQAVFDAAGQPALFYGLSQMPRVPGVENPGGIQDERGIPIHAGYWDTRLFSVICRYLNSGFPVMVANHNHAWVLGGWFTQRGQIKFVAFDDQRGPYQVIDSPFTDERAPWMAIMVPLPPKVYMSGEMAETWGHKSFRSLGSAPGVPPSWRELSDKLGITPKGISLRTFLMDSSQYKESVLSQGRHEDVVRALRLSRLPHYVWVVEAHDRDRRDARQPAVVAEAVFDPDSSDHEHRFPRRDVISMPPLTLITPPEGGKPVPVMASDTVWKSHLPLTTVSRTRRG